MLKFLLLVNKQGQIRLSQYYAQVTRDERFVLEGQLIRKCLLKGKNQCPFLEFNNYKVSLPCVCSPDSDLTRLFATSLQIVFRRYASLYFILGLENSDTVNELSYYELIHFIVETLDKYFENVCELDIMFNLDKAHIIIEEIIMSGRIAETNKSNIMQYMGLLESAAQNNDDINSMIMSVKRGCVTFADNSSNCLPTKSGNSVFQRCLTSYRVSNIAKQILENSCEAMHEILDTSCLHSRSNRSSPVYLDSDLNLEGKMIFHRFHKRKWKMCVDSSKTRIFRMRRGPNGRVVSTNIQLGPNHKIRIEAIDCLGCRIENPDLVETRDPRSGCLIKKDEFGR
ncbi:putative clathrin assembly protein AP19 small subunit [Cryptosporidium canis]|uniref:Clathrin assembly protein AP19 small subunit n=1 Tax=Cryptosporidium canis TaxID=195482 RepID=A0ABQ8PAY5_9CRYT|nr:putative clathrin assembly protein AP19 small subunit [Cryptosporidium canis]KAJ1614713.1 putative clathrin assembly protein AP19 small subunit [Cryptosporidium canis]